MNIHLSVAVSNLEKSIAFYNTLLDSQPVKLKSNYAKYLPKGSNLNLSLNVKNGAISSTGSINHGGLQVESLSEVLALRKKYEDAGLKIKDEMGVTCCYSKQDKFWVQDPDGFNWEVYVLLEDTEAEADLTENGKSICCSTVEGVSCC